MTQHDQQDTPDIDELAEQIDELLDEVEQATAELGEQAGGGATDTSRMEEGARTEPEPTDEAPSQEGSESGPAEASAGGGGAADERDAENAQLQNALDDMLAQAEAAGAGEHDEGGPSLEDADEAGDGAGAAGPEDPTPEEDEPGSTADADDPAPAAGDAESPASGSRGGDDGGAGSVDPFSTLDSELAALADGLMEGDLTTADGARVGSVSVESDADDEPEPTPETGDDEGVGSEPGAADDAESRMRPPASDEPAAGAQASGARAPAPPRDQPGWRAMLRRALAAVGMVVRRCAPVAVRWARRGLKATGPRARAAAELLSRPLAERPSVIRQTIGWFALWTLFMALCVWATLAFFRSPPQPPDVRPEAGLERPEGDGSGSGAGNEGGDASA